MRAEACWVILGCGLLDTVNRRGREYSYGVSARISTGADVDRVGICSVAARSCAYNRETLTG